MTIWVSLPSDNTSKAKRRRRSKQNKTYNILHCSPHTYISQDWLLWIEWYAFLLLLAPPLGNRPETSVCRVTPRPVLHRRSYQPVPEVASRPLFNAAAATTPIPFQTSLMNASYWRFFNRNWTPLLGLEPRTQYASTSGLARFRSVSHHSEHRFKACFVATLGTHWCCYGQTWKKCSSNCCLPLLETLEPDRRPDNPRSLWW